MEVSPLKAQTATSAVHQNGGTPASPAPLEEQQAGAMLVTTTSPAGVLQQSPGCIALNQSYPAALAEHLAVVASKELFLDTLTKFHLALGTRIV